MPWDMQHLSEAEYNALESHLSQMRKDAARV